MNKYPEYIICYVRQRLGLQPDDTSEDDAINAMSESEVFAHVCDWNGLLGYGDTIMIWIKDIFRVDLKQTFL